MGVIKGFKRATGIIKAGVSRMSAARTSIKSPASLKKIQKMPFAATMSRTSVSKVPTMFRAAAKAAPMLKFGAAAAGSAAIAYGVEQIAEKAGIRGGAGFVGAIPRGLRAPGRRKHMNPMNVKATRKAVTRVKSSMKMLRRIEQMLPKRKGNTARGGMPFYTFKRRSKR